MSFCYYLIVFSFQKTHLLDLEDTSVIQKTKNVELVKPLTAYSKKRPDVSILSHQALPPFSNQMLDKLCNSQASSSTATDDQIRLQVIILHFFFGEKKRIFFVYASTFYLIYG